MPLSSVVCVGLSPHVDTCQTSHHDSAKKNNSHSLKQTQNTFMCLASLVQCMYFRRFTKSQSHLQQIPPISFILPQLCAHDAFKITKQLVTEFVLSLTVHQIIPPLHPLSSPPAVSGAPAIAVHSIHGGAHGKEPLHNGGGAVDSRPVQRCPTSGAEGLGDVNSWRAPPALPHPHCSGRNCNLWSEVREFHPFPNCITSWLNGSHYWCL